MKIAVVISTFPPSVGGMGQVAFDEALALARLGHIVTVFTLDYGLRLSDIPFKIAHLSPWVRWGDAGFAPQLFFKLCGFDLIHLHFPFYGGSFFVFLASIFFHVPYVATYHMDAQPKGFLKNVVKFFGDWSVGGLVLKKADKVIIVDKSTKQFSLSKKVKENNLIKIDNAVDTKIFIKKSVSYGGLNLPDLSNKKVLLFVGNLLSVKRLDLVLQAMRKLSDPNLVLIVIGSGYNEENYRFLTKKLSLENQIYFVGSVNKPEILSQYYSLAQATVVPSDYESFSLVVLESLACGTPVIASRISALQNKIDPGVNGLLFERANSDDLADKIKDFFDYTSQERDKIGQNGRNQVIERFSLKKHMADLVKVYQSIV